MKKQLHDKCRSCCPLAGALDILGDRWSLLVIRDLMFFNKHEFNEFIDGPERIATNILTDRLKCLLELEVINSKPHPGHKSKKLYYLTRKGKDLFPVLIELLIWGGSYHAAPDMPRERFNEIKRNPKKFMRARLKEIQAWESKNLELSGQSFAGKR